MLCNTLEAVRQNIWFPSYATYFAAIIEYSLAAKSAAYFSTSASMLDFSWGHCIKTWFFSDKNLSAPFQTAHWGRKLYKIYKIPFFKPSFHSWDTLLQWCPHKISQQITTGLLCSHKQLMEKKLTKCYIRSSLPWVPHIGHKFLTQVSDINRYCRGVCIFLLTIRTSTN